MTRSMRDQLHIWPDQHRESRLQTWSIRPISKGAQSDESDRHHPKEFCEQAMRVFATTKLVVASVDGAAVGDWLLRDSLHNPPKLGRNDVIIEPSD
mgnify:CR=1 FL=1